MTKFFGLKFSFPLFLFLLILSLPALTYSVPDFLSYNCDNDYGNYTNNSTYQMNLETLLFASSLPSLTANSSGFYNLSVGRAPDRVYAMAQCRGDLNAQECRGCIANTTSMINKVCPNRKKAIGVYEQCSLRYSGKSFYGIMEEEPLFTFFNGQDASNVSQFSQAVLNLFERLQSSATSSNNKIMFATGEAEAGPSYTIYAMAQCSRDISRLDCGSCFENSIQMEQTMYPGTIGLAMIKPGCDMRYSVYPAYRPTQYDLSYVAPAPSPSLPVSPTTNKNVKKKKKKSTVTIVAIVGSIGASLIMILSAVYFFLLKRQRKNAGLVDDAYKIEQLQSLQFDFETVKLATDNFLDDNKLGQGGFGAVYKGTLPNGQEVAVKRLSTDSMQGESEFKNEVLLVAKLQHRNLVRIVGFCFQGEERLLLYEFVPNLSLDHHLFDHVRRENLDWETRHKIIGGIARGILYLHEDSRLRIIHRDLKASNILLDEEMNPKISDFGMARLFEMDQTRANTNRVVGTFGYMAPEYVTRGRFSVKSDVFSFGVLVLEIASGQQNNGLHIGEEAEDLLTFAWRNWQEGTPMNIIGQNIRRGSTTEMIRWIHIALLCVQENEAERPTMAQVFVMLNSYSLTLPVPARPAFFMHSTRDDLDESRSEDRIVISSENEATMTDPFPR